MRQAAKIAKSKSRHKCHRHAALILDGKRIRMAGFNHEETHAERDVIFKLLWDQHDRSAAAGYDLLSIRITRGNQFGYSRPCRNCMALIRAAGIRRVTYTDSLGYQITEKI